MKTAFITGVSRGIGKALAEKFLAEGFRVVGTSLTGDVDYSHNKLSVYELDLSKPESIVSCVDRYPASGEKIDIYINNAGVLLDEDEISVVVEKLRKTLEVNLIGTIDLTERMLPNVNNGGHIINISSTAGSLALTGHVSHHMGHYPSYKISKTALNMYTRTLAVRLKGTQIVSSVHPGWVRTDMGGSDADIDPKIAAEHIYMFAISTPDTGHFWFNGEKIEW